MHRLSRLGMVVLVLFCMAGCSTASPKQGTVAAVDTGHRLFEYFPAAYGDKEPILTGVNDINNDGREDLIVIYRDTSVTNKMIAIWEEDGRIAISEPTPAPVENYRLEWRDIDEKAPIELIVSGSKGVNVGYAIYRWENGQFLNLFGDGMEGCC